MSFSRCSLLAAIQASISSLTALFSSASQSPRDVIRPGNARYGPLPVSRCQRACNEVKLGFVRYRHTHPCTKEMEVMDSFHRAQTSIRPRSEGQAISTSHF
jgi:hypothetical protein